VALAAHYCEPRGGRASCETHRPTFAGKADYVESVCPVRIGIPATRYGTDQLAGVKDWRQPCRHWFVSLRLLMAGQATSESQAMMTLMIILSGTAGVTAWVIECAQRRCEHWAYMRDKDL
jgi:hypothetical protein